MVMKHKNLSFQPLSAVKTSNKFYNSRNWLSEVLRVNDDLLLRLAKKYFVYPSVVMETVIQEISRKYVSNYVVLFSGTGES